MTIGERDSHSSFTYSLCKRYSIELLREKNKILSHRRTRVIQMFNSNLEHDLPAEKPNLDAFCQSDKLFI